MPSDDSLWEPRRPRLAAALTCIAAALLLLWPLLLGRTLFGGGSSDMMGAGYAFRLFGAEEFRATGSIPLWNPYLFGGMPYVAAMHGDIFYPTAWLRWVMPADLAITWGMAVHFALAGYAAWLLARAIGLSWTAAAVSGIAYELSGIVASQVSPGHDGKLFVSALAPLAFLALWRAIHERREGWYGWLAGIIGLCVLSPHYQMTYFLLIALGIWTLYLAFSPSAAGAPRQPVRSLALAGGAVAVGIGIAALQILPFLEYIPFSPRATGGPNTGWEYANLFSMPPEELFSTLLPEFNGVLGAYWGRNPFKLHTEYLGAVTLMLAALAWGDRHRRRLLAVLAGLAGVFLLLAFAGHTPFYRPWFEFMPMMKKMRAMGMVFYLVALPVALMAGAGLDRVLRREVRPATLVVTVGAVAGFAVLGVTGVLQILAEGMAVEQRMALVQANAGALRAGSLRLLAVAALTFGFFQVITRQALRGAALAGLACLLVAGDLWLVDRRFFDFSPRASQLFREDDVTRALQGMPAPWRVYDLGQSYPSSTLMAYRIPSVLGYHGNELRYYDELGQKDRGWQALQSPNLLDLLSVRFVILPDTAALPGWHRVAGPVQNGFGNPAVLYERDTVPAYAMVVPSVAAAPDEQIPPTVADPRFPARRVALVSESEREIANRTAPPFPAPTAQATVSAWRPGAMTIQLTGAEPDSALLLVSENWYPGWIATVDGRPGRTIRADHALLGVSLPPGAREVRLRFDSPPYRRGRLVSLLSILLALALGVALSRRGPGVLADA